MKTTNVLHEMVLYDPEAEMAFSFNLSARAVWELCDGFHTTEDISRVLAVNLGCDTAVLFPDVRETIARFRELDLLSDVPTRIPL